MYWWEHAMQKRTQKKKTYCWDSDDTLFLHCVCVKIKTFRSDCGIIFGGVFANIPPPIHLHIRLLVKLIAVDEELRNIVVFFFFFESKICESPRIKFQKFCPFCVLGCSVASHRQHTISNFEQYLSGYNFGNIFCWKKSEKI